MGAAHEFVQDDVLSQDLALLELENAYSIGTLWQCDRDRLMARIGDGPVNTWDRPIIEFTLGREYARKSRAYHEDDTFRWLTSLRSMESQKLRGEYDAETYERFVVSSGKLLQGYAQGGGIERLDSGIDFFREAAEANPDDGRVAAVLAIIQRSAGRIEEAVSSGEINTPEQMVAAGLRRVDEGRHEAALALFERAFEIRPNDVNIQYNRLLALRNTGRQTEFESSLASFLDDFPKDARGYSLNGREMATAGDLDGALSEFKRAVDIDPINPVFQYNYATTLSRLGRYEEAAKTFEEVMRLMPAAPGVPFAAASNYSLARLTDDAARWARHCIDNGLAQMSQFATDPSFANLRESDHWDAQNARLR